LAGCAAVIDAGRPATTATVAAHPDVHGEPLALLPPSPTVWVRVEAAQARRSRHWDALMALLRRAAGSDVRALERELGFDPLATAGMVALALYARPGGVAGATAWPVIYVRGGVDRDEILTAARARAPADDPLVERTVEGVAVHTTRSRTYLFPAPDVLLLFDPALTRRVLRQLAGDERRSAASDPRFDPLWDQIGGAGGVLRVAADLAQMRTAGPVLGSTTSDDPSAALETAVLRLDGAGAVDARVAGRARSDGAAEGVVNAVDDVRATMLRRLEVRTLGLTRLLYQGLTAVHDGSVVRVRLDATEDEALRVLAALRLVQAITR
jgi:hypothetical protein